MASEWRAVDLADCTNNLDAQRVPMLSNLRKPGPYRYFGASGVIDNVASYIYDGDYLLVAEDGENLRTRNTPVALWVTGKFWVNNHAHVLQARSSSNGRFLYYWFQQADISGYLTGTTMPKLSQASLNRISVLLPPLPEQRAIAHILGSIDDKIDLNRRMASTLEEMARALFTSWFVRFDPVRAKMAGQPTGLPAHIEALFPDTLVDSEFGEVPEGWGVCHVRDVAELAGGGTPATSNPLYWEPGIHYWATPKDLASLATPVLLSTGRRISDAGLASISSGLLPVGTILMSSRAPIGYVAVTHVPTAVNQGFIAMRPRAEHFAMFLKHWVIASQELIVSHANGSTFLEISKASFRPLPVISPPPALLARFQIAAGELHARVAAATAEITTLSDLRDALLPKLVSGEVRITDPEAFLRRAGLDTAA